MRRLLVTTACGVALAAAGQTPAMAYTVVPAHGHVQAAVVTAKSLTAGGPQASGWGQPGNAVSVTATVTNPNTFRYWAHTVTAKVTDTDRCAPADFSVEGSPVTVGRALAANGTITVTGLSVRLAQQAPGGCEHATVTLTYYAS